MEGLQQEGHNSNEGEGRLPQKKGRHSEKRTWIEGDGGFLNNGEKKRAFKNLEEDYRVVRSRSFTPVGE